MPERYEVCPVAEFPPGERRIVDAGGVSVGVFNVDGEFHALANVCPHQRAPLCEGTVTGVTESDGPGDFRATREGEIIQCPWHGWKFAIADGTSVFNPHLRTRTYETDVEAAGCVAGEAVGRSADRGVEDEAAAEDEVAEYGAQLAGDPPPVESYDVEVEDAVVVVYV